MIDKAFVYVKKHPMVALGVVVALIALYFLLKTKSKSVAQASPQIVSTTGMPASLPGVSSGPSSYAPVSSNVGAVTTSTDVYSPSTSAVNSSSVSSVYAPSNSSQQSVSNITDTQSSYVGPVTNTSTNTTTTTTTDYSGNTFGVGLPNGFAGVVGGAGSQLSQTPVPTNQYAPQIQAALDAPYALAARNSMAQAAIKTAKAAPYSSTTPNGFTSMPSGPSPLVATNKAGVPTSQFPNQFSPFAGGQY